MRPPVAVINMKLLYVPVAICVRLFICRLRATFH